MPFSRSKYIELKDKFWPIFFGGLVDNAEPNLIPYACTPYGRNFRVNGQGITIRPGYSTLVGGIAWANQVGCNGIGLFASPPTWALSTGTSDHVITAIFNTTATSYLHSLRLSDNTQTSINTAGIFTSTTSQYNFQQMASSLYITNGVDEMAVIDKNWVSNKTTASARWNLPAGVSSLRPSFCVVYDAHTWVGWGATTLTAGGTDSGGYIYRSATNNGSDFTGTGFGSLAGDFPFIGWVNAWWMLFFFTKRSVFNVFANNTQGNVSYTSRQLETTEGAVCHASVINIGKDVFYLSSNNKICKLSMDATGRYDSQDISHRNGYGIAKTMATLDPDQSRSFVYHNPREQIIKFFVKTKGATWNDLCIVYNYQYDQFMADTNKPFSGWLWYQDKKYTCSALEPKIILDEEGFTDDDAPIQFEYNTKNIDLDYPTTNKELWELRSFVGINTLAELNQNVIADGSVVDTFQFNKTMIPIYSSGIGTQQIWVFPIGQEWSPDNSLYNVSCVREKANLQIRNKYFRVQYKCSSLGAQVLLQWLRPSIEMLNTLTSSTN